MLRLGMILYKSFPVSTKNDLQADRAVLKKVETSWQSWMPEINIGAARMFESGRPLFSRFILSCLQEYVVPLCRADQSYGKAYLFTLVDRAVSGRYKPGINELRLVYG